MFLNAAGKWSLIDIYVLAMMMVASRYHVESSITSETTGAELPYTFDLYILPRWGFYGFMCGACSLAAIYTRMDLHSYVH